MIRVLLCLLLLTSRAVGQPVSVFAHNDYEKAHPLHDAYRLQVRYLEVDVFLEHGHLLVAHSRQELNPERTLEQLYLQPLEKIVSDNQGYAYADTTKHLALVIDLKSEGAAFAVIAAVQQHAALIGARNFQIILSGAVPDRALWADWPAYIRIDGRLGIAYTTRQWARIALVSSRFPGSWSGTEALDAATRNKLVAMRETVQVQGKPLRFWATPDREEAWRELISLGLTVINTDDPARLISFLAQMKE